MKGDKYEGYTVEGGITTKLDSLLEEANKGMPERINTIMYNGNWFTQMTYVVTSDEGTCYIAPRWLVIVSVDDLSTDDNKLEDFDQRLKDRGYKLVR